MIPRKFLSALNELNKIPDLNYGGCLAAAWYLHKRFGCQIIQLGDYYNEKDYHNNVNFLNNKSKTASSSNHFGVTFDKGKTVYDSTGEINAGKFFYRLVIPLQDTARFTVSALNKSCWNPSFDRQKYLNRLTKGLHV